FYEQLKQLSEEYPQAFKLFLTVNQPTDNWNGLSGFINKPDLEKIFEESIYVDKGMVEYFICGPEEMMVNTTKWLEELAVPKENIRKEYFTAPVVQTPETVENENAMRAASAEEDVTSEPNTR